MVHSASQVSPAIAKCRPGRRRPRAGTLAKSRKRTLLWIDDYKPGLVTYKAIYERLGYRVITATTGISAIRIASTRAIDAVITDFEMPGMNGGEVAIALKTSNPKLPVIVFSGSCLIPDRIKELVDGVCDKAGPSETLLATIEQTLAILEERSASHFALATSAPSRQNRKLAA